MLGIPRPLDIPSFIQSSTTSACTLFILFSFHFHSRFYFSPIWTCIPFTQFLLYLHPNFSCNLLSFTFLLLLPVFILNRTSFIIFFFHLLFSYPSAKEEQIIKIQLLFTFSNLIGDDNYLLNALYIYFLIVCENLFIYVHNYNNQYYIIITLLEIFINYVYKIIFNDEKF